MSELDYAIQQFEATPGAYAIVRFQDDFDGDITHGYQVWFTYTDERGKHANFGEGSTIMEAVAAARKLVKERESSS